MKIFVLTLLFAFEVSAAVKPLPFFTSNDLTPYWESSAPQGAKPAEVSEFKAVVDQAGQAVVAKDFGGKVTLVNFFFADCPTVCPTMMNTLNDFKAKHSIPQMYSFSVQPDYDTPSVLKAYAKTHKLNLEHWSLLTGSEKEIYRVGREMFKADGSNSPARTSFTHSRNVYLLDPQRRIRGVYDTGSPEAMSLLATDLQTLLQKPE